MILKVASNFKIPFNIYLRLSQRNFLYIVIVSVSINSILSISIKHILLIFFFAMMIEIKYSEVIGMCFFMLFCLTVQCQCKFYSKLTPPNRCLVTSLEHRHSPYWST